MKRIWIILICFVGLLQLAAAGTTPKSKKEVEKSVVHIYRPARFVGFGWNFKVRTNGEVATRLKNGKHQALQLEPGTTEFRIKDSKVEIDLQPGEHYYLRASLTRNMLLGKPEMIEVSRQQAKSELDDL